MHGLCLRFQIQGGRLHHYVGSYSQFLKARAARHQQEAQAYKAKQEEIARLQGFVDRFGAKATKASAANSRKKMIDRLKQQLPEAPVDGNGSSTVSESRRSEVVVWGRVWWRFAVVDKGCCLFRFHFFCWQNWEKQGVINGQ